MLPSPNPYAPPGAGSTPLDGGLASAPHPPYAPYARVAAVSLGLGACLGTFLGVAQTVQYGSGLQHFDGMMYVPRIVGLSTVRALGSGAALLVTCVSAAIVLHRAGRRAAPGSIALARDPRALWLGAGTLATFGVVCGLTMLAGAMTASSMFGASAGAFLAAGRAGLTWGDLARGLLLSLADGVLCVAVVPLVGGWLAAPRRSLVLKLFVAYAAVQATTVLEQTALSLLDG